MKQDTTNKGRSGLALAAVAAAFTVATGVTVGTLVAMTSKPGGPASEPAIELSSPLRPGPAAPPEAEPEQVSPPRAGEHGVRTRGTEHEREHEEEDEHDD